MRYATLVGVANCNAGLEYAHRHELPRLAHSGHAITLLPVIHVFVSHFKSRRPAQIWRERDWYNTEVHGPHTTALGYAISTIRRTAEATALRVIVTALTKNSDTPVVLLGDMNDGK